MTNSSVWAGTTSALQHNVYQGVWTNWSRGRIMGATLTLDRGYGNLLIAFTATFVGLVATATWRVSCFCFHRIYSTSDPRDALHHQRQAILRNSSSAASGFWTMSKLAWTWRHDSQQLLARILPALVISGLCSCLFTIAAGFSSSISSGVGNEVLLDGNSCGLVYRGNSSAETVSALYAYSSQAINNAVNYAHECYSQDATGNFDCTTFIKDHLPGAMDDQAGCPFQEGMCRSNQSNLFLDSGYLDSREHFGLNTPDSDRIFFRTTMHCAPLSTDGFSENISTTANNYTQYFYGPYVADMDFTFQTEDMNAQYTRAKENKMYSWSADMGLSVLHATTANKSVQALYSLFVPDPRLFRSDADLYLIFLSGNGVTFYEPTDDPWYRGFIPWSTMKQVGYNKTDSWIKTIYRPEEAASPMGCIQQYQYCNAEHKCGELASLYDAKTTAAPLFDTSLEVIQGYAKASGRMSSQFSWFQSIIYSYYDLLELIVTLGSASLASRRNLESGHLGKLPNDQWKLDVTNWWTTLLAAAQAAFVRGAHGPPDMFLRSSTIFPENEYMEDLCRNQKIRSTKYTSFSLFGLYFTFTVGVLVILVSYLLEPVFELLVHRRNYKQYKYLEWTGNETLQLQRMAYQGLGSGAWSGYADSVPKTQPGHLADIHIGYSVEPSKEVEPAVKRTAHVTIRQVPQPQDNPNANRPKSFTDTVDTRSLTNIRTPSTSDTVALPDVVSPTDGSFLEISPRLMSSELDSGQPVSPISQASLLEGSGPTVQSGLDFRL